MYTVQYGGKAGRRYSLRESEDMVAVRTRSRQPASGGPQTSAPLTPASRAALRPFELIQRFNEAGVEIYSAEGQDQPLDLRNAARSALKDDQAVAFAGRVLVDEVGHSPVLYTENAFVKFESDVTAAQARELLARYGLAARRALGYARNAWFVKAQEGIGLDLFELMNRVLHDDAVQLAHPELLRRLAYKGAFPQQWHLKRTRVGNRDVDAHAHVEDAWALSQGLGVTIAIIDDGVDLDHEEFASPGKLVAPRDVTLGHDNPRPGRRDRHGTACAGVACANGNFGASGVAPLARLMPIRFASGLGSQQEADAFAWAAQNGADIISCSWGPEDGDWSDPADPLHQQVVPLPDSTRLAIDFAVSQGRGGKGCVLLFAAGNGNESVDNDGYASCPQVMAVAACNDLGKRSAYSDTGRALWCSFPSNETVLPRLTPGIWTTDNSGPAGYNPGQSSRGDMAGNYTNSFGGTSSACPGAAGVAALVLARNPDLRWDEVRELMKRACDRIDTAAGQYDASGHSPWYGFGRLNARTAVELALPIVPPPSPTPPTGGDTVVTAMATRSVAIRDLKTARLTLKVAERAKLKEIKVGVDIEHSYIGDLVISLRPPAALKLPDIVLQDRQGENSRDLVLTFEVSGTPALAALAGCSAAGSWALLVQDTAKEDQGRIRRFGLQMRL